MSCPKGSTTTKRVTGNIMSMSKTESLGSESVLDGGKKVYVRPQIYYHPKFDIYGIVFIIKGKMWLIERGRDRIVEWELFDESEEDSDHYWIRVTNL